MNKKSLLAAVLFAAVMPVSFAQKANVKGAESLSSGSKPNFAEARTLIGEAMKNPETMNDAKTWFVAGQVEERLFTSENLKQTVNQEPDRAAMNDALLRVLPFYLKADQLDNTPDEKGKVKPKFTKKIMESLKGNHLYYINAGGYYMEKKDFKKALEAFDQFMQIKELPMFAAVPEISAQDSNSMMVGFFSAICAYQANDLDKTLEICNKIKDVPYRQNDVYQLIATVYQDKKDTEGYIRMLEEGVQKFPKEAYYLLNLINKYIETGRTAEAISSLERAIADDPQNVQLYDVMAKLYENTQNYDKAEEWLKKGLALDPNNASVCYDLGRVYYNRAADLKGADQVNAETEAKAKEYLQKALPLLEKAYSINPDESWYVLRNVYYNLKMNDKYKELTERHEGK
ncbi:hypothetical protein HQ42_02680 [Porphyromonas gulae]|uniref:Tetratricopeptide repeat protein n=1 Tax=Porphyromonas gulae TaxID=111105 RepID=A0A0A2F430_9PORP|nr:tetratricopeptide repeat protein [Porphyromonas gulae]KGN84790.1 hypothetical protein HR15_10555 [Porphyromonas gulae]KGO03022.1 hypothetical protein HQ42_02680 [Porphyromonas gulae]